MIDARKLDRTITIERLTRILDEYRAEVETWAPVATLAAQRIENGTREFVRAYGQVKRSPAAGIVAEFSGLALRLAAELGLTPVSRSRPAIRDDEGDDEDDALGLS